MNNCAQEYSCPDPTIAIDPFVTSGNRFVDISAGGPTPFTFSTTSNASWVNIESGEGSISPSAPEQRVFLSVDWSKVSGVQSTKITFKATVPGQKRALKQATIARRQPQDADALEKYVPPPLRVPFFERRTDRKFFGT